MKVLLQGKLLELDVTTIFLAPDRGDVVAGRDLKMFFCFNCRMPVTQYTGRVAMIVPGEPPSQATTLLRCKNKECGMLFSFESAV